MESWLNKTNIWASKSERLFRVSPKVGQTPACTRHISKKRTAVHDILSLSTKRLFKLVENNFSDWIDYRLWVDPVEYQHYISLAHNWNIFYVTFYRTRVGLENSYVQINIFADKDFFYSKSKVLECYADWRVNERFSRSWMQEDEIMFKDISLSYFLNSLMWRLASVSR